MTTAYEHTILLIKVLMTRHAIEEDSHSFHASVIILTHSGLIPDSCAFILVYLMLSLLVYLPRARRRAQINFPTLFSIN